MSDVVAVVLLFGVTAYALFGGADFGAGFWDLIAGGARTGRAPARGDRPLDRPGVGGEPRLADLLPRRAVDRVPGGVRVDHAHAVRAAHARRARHRAARLELRVPQGGDRARRASATSAPRSRRRRCSCPYCMGAVAGAIASGRVPPGGKAGDPWTSWVNPTSILGGVLAVTVCAYLAAVYLVWDARRLGDDEMVEYFRRRAVGAAIVAGVIAFAGIFVLHADAPYLFDGLTSRALPLVIISGLCGIGSLVLLLRQNTPWRAPARDGRGRDRRDRVGRRAVALHPPDELKVSAAAAPDAHARGRSLVVFVVAAVVILPSLGLLYYLDQRDLLEVAAEPEAAAGTTPS